MKRLYLSTYGFLPKLQRFLQLQLCLLLLFICTFASGCQRKINYFDYVSELRSNYLTAQSDVFSLRVYAVEKEYPYATDGIKHETSMRTEIRLIAPSGNHDCSIHFSVDGNSYGGDMSFDIVKGEYYYSCAIDTSRLQTLECSVTFGEETFSMRAKTIKTELTISPEEALRVVYDSHSALFDDLTDKYGFAGEICIRLIFEQSPYYYVGVVARDGKMTAFLLNAESGKILAQRQT